jgi:nickel transport protein
VKARRGGVLAPALAMGLLAMGLLAAGPATAHRMKVFATAEPTDGGAVVAGYAYFGSGARAADGRVVATAPDGTRLYEGTTDAAGEFRFVLLRPTALKIAVDGEDGHSASFTLGAADPASLPGPAPQLSLAPQFSPGVPAAPPELRLVVEQAVARQIRPLREQIDAAQDRVYWHDVTGGIGFIVGIAGFAYGLAMGARYRSGPGRAPR